MTLDDLDSHFTLLGTVQIPFLEKLRGVARHSNT